MANTDDIRKTGPVGLQSLSAEQRERIRRAQEQSIQAYTGTYNLPVENTSEVQRYSPDESMASWGTSKYDAPIQPQYLPEGEMQDVRYNNQPWYDTLANGTVKMLGTAGTTFLSSLVGLPAGLVTAAAEGRASGLWDNAVTKGLGDVDKWMEENFTNYKSTEQQNAKWYDPTNLFSMNFLADSIIKNAGFTLGAAASMAVGSGAMGLLGKAAGLVNKASDTTKMANSLISALFSATGEGMIEARQGVEERNKAEIANLENAMIPQYNALDEQRKTIEEQYALTGDYDTYRKMMEDNLYQRGLLDQKMEQGRRQIEESGLDMGNRILLGNQVLLTAGNIIQFGKTMAKSFDAARHTARTAEKSMKPSWLKDGFDAVRRDASDITKGYDITSKRIGQLKSGLKGFFTEGQEEMNQQFIQSEAGAKYNERDANDYWRARMNKDAYRETTRSLYGLGNTISQGFKDSWGNIDQWEQFLVGGLTGLAGSYAPTKLFNQDKSKSIINPMRYGEWSGGAYNEISEFNKKYNQYAENIDDLNKALAQEDFGSRVQSLIARTYLEGEKQRGVDVGDMKAYKDADDKQTIHDIQAFHRAGKIDDLRAIYEEMGKDLSDDEVQSIVDSTTRKITAEDDKKNHDAAIDEQIAARQREVDGYYDQLEEYQTSLENTPEESKASRAEYVKRQTESLMDKITKGEAEINRLKDDKENYVNRERYEGPYVDDKGQRTVSDDEIRDAVRHNAEEMQRKLDSYLESIDVVDRDSGGRLTKDQEDNLAYIHNVAKEKDLRTRKIVAPLRNQLGPKFILKTSKTPEQLTNENVVSDLVFSRNDDTPEGWVDVDTSMMTEDAFVNFFIRDVLNGGNISPEFGETADEKAAREREEANEAGLSEEERKKRKKERLERLTDRWRKAMDKKAEDAKDQRSENIDRMVENFRNNYRKDGKSSKAETEMALVRMLTSIAEAEQLAYEAGEYRRTLDEYMLNPNKVDEDKRKEEKKIEKEEKSRSIKERFGGKTAKQINQEAQSDDSDFDFDDIDDFVDSDVDVSDDEVKAAHEEAKKAQGINQKKAEIKRNMQQQADEMGIDDDIVDLAMASLDAVAYNAEDEDGIDIDEIINDLPTRASLESDEDDDTDIEEITETAASLASIAFTKYQEDKDKRDSIQDDVDDIDDMGTPEDTGHDEAPKVPAETAEPETRGKGNNEEYDDVTPKGGLTQDALDHVISEIKRMEDTPSTSGTWRSTTTRFKYHSAFERYSDALRKDPKYGEDSIEYKRALAIEDYLQRSGAYDRVESVDKDSLLAKQAKRDTNVIHFMVRSFADEIFGRSYEELTEDEKPKALAIIMLDYNGEVLGDLPLAQFEPSFRNGNPTTQVKTLKAMQDKMFKAFSELRAKDSSCREAMADASPGIDMPYKLNLTFDGRQKNPLVSRISQVMNGVVPFLRNSTNTLNDVMGSQLKIGIAVTGTQIAAAKKKENDFAKGRVASVMTGNIGQPYLLLPSANGKYIPIPFYTKPFDAQRHKDTDFYRLLTQSLAALMQDSGSQESNSDTFKRNMGMLEALLQVKRQEGAKRVIERKDGNVTLHLQSLTDETQKIDITVQDSGDTTETVSAIAERLSGTPVNVSLQYINNTIGPARISYNKVIGDIADVNLPKDTTHTVNNWFTVNLVSESKLQRDKVEYRQTGTHTEVIGGRSVDIDTDTYKAYDPKTGEQITGDEEINLFLAEVKAAKQTDKTKPFKIDIDGETRTYDPVGKKFTKTSQGTGMNAGQPSLRVQEQVRKEKEAGQRWLANPANEDWLGSQWNEYNSTDGEKTAEGFMRWLRDSNNDNAVFIGIMDSVEKYSMEDFSKAVDRISKGKAKSSPKQAPAQTPVQAPVENNSQDDELPTLDDLNDIQRGNEESGGRGIQREDKREEHSETPQVQRKTIEEIEKEVADNKTVTKQNRDAWDAIPDELKTKLVNGEANVVLEYQGKKVTLSYGNLIDTKNKLIAANTAARMKRLKVSEAVKPMERDGVTASRESERKARRWLAKNLPMLNSDERVNFVERLSRAGNDGSKMWAAYKSGVIEIMRNAPEGTVYHEAFHYVMDMVLTDDQKRIVLDLARQEYGDMSNIALEERLANDFRKYSLDENAEGISGKIKRWIRKIWDAIRRYNRISNPTINQLFWRINNGEFAAQSRNMESFEENQRRILREINSIQNEKLQWDNLTARKRDGLKYRGLSKETYSELSQKEKEQYLRCV